MSKVRSFYKPPIKEAVLELKFFENIELTKEISNDFLSLLNKEDYTKSSDIIINNLNLNFSKIEDNIDDNQKFDAELKKNFMIYDGVKIEGYMSDFIIILNSSSLAIIQVKNYKSFEYFIEVFYKIFNIINNLILIEKVKRIGIRFINSLNMISLSKNILDKSVFIKDSELSSFEKVNHLQTIYDFDNSYGGKLNVFKEQEKENIIIDIDVSFNSEISINENEKINHIYTKLREIKNNIFFNLVSEDYKGIE